MWRPVALHLCSANHRLREHCSSCKEGRTEQNERSVLHQQNIHAWQLRIKLEWRVAPDVFYLRQAPIIWSREAVAGRLVPKFVRDVLADISSQNEERTIPLQALRIHIPARVSDPSNITLTVVSLRTNLSDLLLRFSELLALVSSALGRTDRRGRRCRLINL